MQTKINLLWEKKLISHILMWLILWHHKTCDLCKSDVHTTSHLHYLCKSDVHTTSHLHLLCKSDVHTTSHLHLVFFITHIVLTVNSFNLFQLSCTTSDIISNMLNGAVYNGAVYFGAVYNGAVYFVEVKVVLWYLIQMLCLISFI